MDVDLAGHPGILVRPPGARWLYVLAHGAGAGMRHAFMEAIATELAARAVATLRWEFPYMAAGRARPDQPAVAEASVRAVWDAARALVTDLPRFAGGKSFGGRMTSRAHAAAPLAELYGIAFLGFPLHPPDKPGPPRSPRGRLAERAGKGISIERAEHLAAARGPLLFVQGDRDELAQLQLLRPVVRALGRRAKLVVIAHADHGFDVPKRIAASALPQLADTVAAWMDRVTVAACGRATRRGTRRS